MTDTPSNSPLPPAAKITERILPVPVEFRNHVSTITIVTDKDHACICGTCAFWNDKFRDDMPVGRGACQRRAPEFRQFLEPETGKPLPPDYYHAWTPVEHWCGEWQRRGGELIITDVMIEAGLAALRHIGWSYQQRVSEIYKAMLLASKGIK